MNRENWIPLIGLVGLALAGGGMLWATSGKEPIPVDAPGAKGGKAKANTAPRPKLLVNKGIGDRPWAREGAPNVILVVGCSLRRDALGPYGGSEALTPALNGMASQGALFEDAIAAGVWTKESLAAMSTGRHAVELGVVEPLAKASARTLDKDVATLAEVFADNGYWTVGVNASPPVNKPNSALWQGFDYVRDAHPEGWKVQHRLPAVHAVQQSIRMMNEAPEGRPFFLQLVVSDSHKPIRVPKAEAEPWSELDNPHYMATVRRLDDALGMLLTWTQTMGIEQDTYVVFVADHGEGLDRPEHHGPAHGRFLASSAVQVPWIVRGPGIEPGSTVGGLASGVDVAPTLLGLAGIEEGLDEGISGMDLSEALRTAGPTGRTEAYVDTWYLNANRAALWTEETHCQKDFGSKNLDEDPFVDACFDRAEDPLSETPVDRPELMAKLEAWRAERAGPDAAEDQQEAPDAP